MERGFDKAMKKTSCYILLFFGLLFLLAFLLGEAYLRFSGYKIRALPWAWTADDNGLTVLDGKRIWSLRPNYKADLWGLRTDSNGFRVSSNGLPPSEIGRVKICFAGDSNVFGHGVAGDQTVPYYLQGFLRGAGYDVAVINAGVVGYSPGQEYIALKDMIIPLYNPALVLWGVHFNDTLDMRWRSLHYLRDNELVRIPGWSNGIYLQGLAQKATPGFLRNSRLLNYLISCFEYVDPVYWLERPSNTTSADKIRLMVEDVEKRGTPVLVLRMASIWELTGTDPVTEAFYSGFTRDFTKYMNLNESVKEWAAKAGAKLSEDVHALIQRCVLAEESDPLRHLSPLGNKVCAEAIFNYLVQNGLTNNFPKIKSPQEELMNTERNN